MDISVERFLRGALKKLGGAERLGELYAELGDSDAVDLAPITTRANVLGTLGKLLGQFGSGSTNEDEVTPEMIQKRIETLRSSRITDQDEAEPGGGEDEPSE